MGANSSTEAHLLRAENFVNDPTAFRVFTKKRNKFIPGWLKVNDEEIIFTRGGTASFQFWPLAYLRRYGYTCSGVFFFESGRRCATGEGLHTFQSHQAETIFQVVQSRIRIEEYARGSSRASSVASNRHNSVSSNAGRIHPIQRFSSEGSGNTNNNGPQAQSFGDVGQAFAPAIRSRQRLPSSSSAHSAIVGAVGGGGGGGRAERPRSVLSGGGVPIHLGSSTSPVSAADHMIHSTGPTSNGGGDSLLQFVPPHSYLHNRNYSPASALMSGSCIHPHQLMMAPASSHSHHHPQYQQQHQNLMARSFNSTSTSLNAPPSSDGGGGGGATSPWTSQSMLLVEGDIAAEHVLSPNNRVGGRILQPQPHFQPRPIHPHKYHHHSYVNVQLAGAADGPPLPIRELHRTNRTIQRDDGGAARAPSASSIATASTLAGSPLPPTDTKQKYQSSIPMPPSRLQQQGGGGGQRIGSGPSFSTAFRPFYNSKDPSRHLRLPQPPPPSVMTTSAIGSFSRASLSPSSAATATTPTSIHGHINPLMSNSVLLPGEGGFNNAQRAPTSTDKQHLTLALNLQEATQQGKGPRSAQVTHHERTNKAMVNYTLIDLERTPPMGVSSPTGVTATIAGKAAPADPEPTKGASSKGSFLFRRKAASNNGSGGNKKS